MTAFKPPEIVHKAVKPSTNKIDHHKFQPNAILINNPPAYKLT